MLLGNGKGDSRKGNVEWFQYSLVMDMFLQIQLQSGVERNAVLNDLRGPPRCMDFSILADVGEGKKDFVMLSEST